MPEIEIAVDPDAQSDIGARRLVSLAKDAIAARGRFHLALAGGSTPQRMYMFLAQPPYSRQVDWSKVVFLWGDERCVPPEDSLSNYRMARETLLDHIPAREENILRMEGELGPDLGARRYEGRMHTFFQGDSLPALDLVLLGLGEDGHTASLFPGSPAVSTQSEAWTAGVEHLTPPLPLVARITLTPRVLNAAANVIFLVSGQGKAARLAQVLEGPYQPDSLPAQIVRPPDGRLVYLVDREAASQLTTA